MRPVVVVSLALTALVAACADGATNDASPDRRTRDPAAPAGAEGFTVCYDATRSGGGGAAISLADVSADVGLDEPLRGMHAHATAVGDVDGDGWTDLFVGTFADRPVE